MSAQVTPIQVYMPAGEAREGKLRAAIEADKQGRFAWAGNASDLPGDVRFKRCFPCPVCDLSDDTKCSNCEDFGLKLANSILDVEIKDFTGEGNSDYLSSILNGHLWDQVTKAKGPYVIAVLGDDADISSSIRKAAGHGKGGKHGSFDLDKFASYANMVDGFEANCIGQGIQVWHLGYNQFPRLLLRARKILEGGNLNGFAPKPMPGERQAVALSILAGDGIGPAKAKNILQKFDLCLMVKDGCLAELEDCSGIGPKLASRIRENIEVVD
jgi:hypothetical protein